MSEKVEAILTAAMKLTDEQRVDLAERIALSVSREYQAEVDRAWDDEIRRRIGEIDDGTAELVSWDDVRDELLKRARQ